MHRAVVFDRLCLHDRYNISYADIGRVEVGTESALDNSKAVKTVIMQLFEPSGNHNVEVCAWLGV